MRVKNKKTYYLKKKTIVEDDEGGKYQGFEDNATEIQAYIYPASGKLQAEIYGERLNYIMNMLYDDNIELNEGDGICFKARATDKPDYKIISIKEYTSHKLLELEKMLWVIL